MTIFGRTEEQWANNNGLLTVNHWRQSRKSIKQCGFTLIEAAIVAVFIGLLIAMLMGDAYTCEGRAKLMNMRYDWSILQGCMIEPKPGQWIPLKNYRVTRGEHHE